MKKMIMAAFAATMMSSTANAVQLPAEGQVCSDIHSNISSGINIVELSDYRKCVMIQHDINTAFTYKTFYVRTGDQFTAFPVETLAKMNDSERREAIKEVIIEKIIEKEVEVRVEVIKEIIKTEYVTEYFEDMTEINRLNDLIDELQPLADSVDGLDKRISELMSDVADLEDSIKWADIALAAELGEIGLVSPYTGKPFTVKELGWDDGELGAAIDQMLTAAVTANLTAWIDTSKGIAHGMKDAKLAAATKDGKHLKHGDGNAAYASVTRDGNDIKSSIVRTAGNPYQGITFIPTNLTVDKFVFHVKVAFSEGYARGFEQGYDEGYKQGYADGFRDGVNSVN